MAKTIAGPPCPDCDFPILVEKSSQVGTIVKCPACGEESEIANESKAEVGGTSSIVRDFALTLSAGALLLFILTKGKKSTKVR